MCLSLALDKSTTNEKLVKLCLRLQNQVWEMEKFLNDYGMITVGRCKEHDERANSQLPGATNARKTFEINYDLVLQNIQELNIVAGEGQSHVTATPGGAKLTQQSSIPLCGPFRSYQDPSTQECMQDLMDGFFPSELQDRFPNGVPFQVRTSDTRFEHDFGMIHSYCITLNCQSVWHLGKKLSMEQFLQKLPVTVVKEGKVISIRDSIKAHLLVSAVIHSATTSLTFPIPTHSEDGMETFIMKMYFTETIRDLRHYLDLKRGPGAAPYDIISAFPHQCYSDYTQTLLSCGLTPNAALLLRPQASSHRQCAETYRTTLN
uniref:UBX domain-containing protein 11 n=1 Tax=Sinocyclocheilus rhinocerous TaxID=307959 RepID=A0A673KT62_9TELE